MTDFDGKHFWDWTDFQSYLECILVFGIVGAAAMFMFSDVPVFVETVGFLAVFVEGNYDGIYRLKYTYMFCIVPTHYNLQYLMLQFFWKFLAMLGVPQFLRNYKNSSTRGMNRTMVMMWTCGDVFKTTYFVMRSAPIQFTVCGTLQIGVDLAILTQIWFYGGQK